MRFRLRYLHHDLELSEGEFALGRSPDCQLSLDDPRVSRRHALLVVTKDTVTVEDLQSRNGVMLNGQRIAQPTVLGPGDKIVIGSQELTLLQRREVKEQDLSTTTQVARRTLGAMPSQPVAPAEEASPPAATANAAIDPMDDPNTARRADAFKLLGGVADKALAMGRTDEAERVLASALAHVLEAKRSRRRQPPALVDAAARFAARLATITAKAAWAEYVFELYDGEDRLCPAPVIDELYNALRKIKSLDLARLRGYLEHLRKRQAMLGPADKFLLQRIEGLERLAALR